MATHATAGSAQALGRLDSGGDLSSRLRRSVCAVGVLLGLAVALQPLHAGQSSAETAAMARRPFAVAASGAKGDAKADDRPAIQKTIEAAIAAGVPAEVVFEAGKTYRLAANTRDVAALHVSGAKDLVLSGNGAVLMAHPSNRVMSISDSRDVTIRDFTLDYNPLPFTQARLVDVRADQGLVRFRVEDGYAAPRIGDQSVYRDFKSSDAVFLDGRTKAFTHAWARIQSVSAVEQGVFEARFHGTDLAKRLGGAKAGDFIALKLGFPEPPPTRDSQGRFLTCSAGNVYVCYSHDIRIERVTSYAAPVMTFLASASEAVVLDGCKVIRKPGTDRLIAGNSDGAHFKSLTRMPQVRNSVFEALMDDSINIKVSSERITEVQGRHLRLTHGDIFTDDAVVQPGQSLVFSGGAARRHLGCGKVQAVHRVGYRDLRMTLEAAVEGLAAGDLVYLLPTNEAIVSRCEFRTQLKTALVVRPPCLVSHCSFADVAYGVHSLFTDRIEGPPPFGLRVTDCTFSRPWIAAIALHLPSRAAGLPDRQALLAQRCKMSITAPGATAVTASHRRGIVLQDIEISVQGNCPPFDWIRLNDCQDVRQDNVKISREAARP